MTTIAEISPEELVRLRRAVAEIRDYEFERIPGSNSYWVRRTGGARYLTTEHACSCPDHQQRQVTCKHMCMVQGLLEREGRVTPAERSAQARKDREMWA